MKAAVIAEPGKICIERTAVPEVQPNEVLVRLEGCGVCASNVPVWEGKPWFQYPLKPGQTGHEGWGYVEALGTDVRSVAVGDRVAMLSNHAYAEYDVADAHAVVKLPAALDGQPFPGEPLGCAINIFKRSDIHPGQTVAIVGIGFLGVLLTQLAAGAGARVIALSRRQSSLDLAKQFGAAETVLMDDHWRVIEEVRQLTDGQFCDRVIEAAGKQWPLDLAAELTRERGTLIIAGYHQDGARQINMQLWNWRGLDVINAHERDTAIYVQGMREAVDAVLKGTLNPAPLYTHTFPLEHLDDALNLVKQVPEGFVKALTVMA